MLPLFITAALAEQGYSHTTLQQIAPVLLAVAHELKDYRDLRIGEKEIQTATRHATQTFYTPSKDAAGETFREMFAREARRWLRFLGRLEELDTNPVPSAGLLEDFVSWMERERGLSPKTIKNRRWHIEKFLRWFGQKRRSISMLHLADVDAYQVACKARGLSRTTIKIHTNAIRAFVRYASSRECCPSSIAEGIEGPRIYAQEKLPAGPCWKDVKRMISSLDTNDPVDVRDRAIIMLFAVYGLRASEVSRLRLDHFDWEHDQITVPRYKQRLSQPYPLAPAVGRAIVRYLKEVRPKCNHREVFITQLPPLRPMSCGSLYQTVARCMRNLGIKSLAHHGPHSLRHACAAHLLSEGFALKEIGDHLGHKSASSTRIYAKVNLPGLREVASFDLGGVL